MVADEHDGAGEPSDRSEEDLAEVQVQESNGQSFGLARQSAQKAPLNPFTSTVFPSKSSQSLAISSTDAAQSTAEDNVADMKGTNDGSTAVSKTTSGGSPEAPPQIPSPLSSLGSPSSSRTRDREFSVRRAILARNVHELPESSGSAIELQPRAASALQQVSVGNGSGKKPEATITISQVLDTGDGFEKHPSSIKKVYEALALPHYENWIKSKETHTGLLSRLRAAKERVRKKILRIQEIPPSKDGRHIDVNPNRRECLIDERTGRRYIKNTITSSRYTLYNFLPRQLFAQFSKLANFYFLCVSILQMIPGLSTTGTYTTIVPLAFFVFISMAKEGYDDLRRYKQDRAENRNTALVLREHKVSATDTDNRSHSTATFNEQDYCPTKWEDIEVGDVVKLARDEPAPADLAVLHTNGAKAYVETMALDGETNLKSKQALPQLARSCRTAEDVASCEAHIVVEDPNLDLYNFEGRVTVRDETLPLANNEIIYRGSVLRNTSEVIAIVVYSGEECKIRMNATKNPRIKAVSPKTSRDPLLNTARANTRRLACSSNCSEQGCCHACHFRDSPLDF